MTSPSTERAQTDRIVWIDCEMTGLSLASDALVEVAALVTDYDLTVLGEGVDVVIRPPDAALAQMGDFVREMHTGSGLLDELATGTTLEEAQAMVLDYVREWAPEAGKAPLGGNTVATDRAFLARDMPALEAHLHYRIIDVSSIKELSRRWFPRAYFSAPQKTGGHRALADIRESIAELRYYREAVFVPAPGPSTEQARSLAARHVVTHQVPAPDAAKVPAPNAGKAPSTDTQRADADAGRAASDAGQAPAADAGKAPPTHAQRADADAGKAAPDADLAAPDVVGSTPE